jgi:hypothetical protein
MSDVEEHLRRAMEEGKFADLPGKGKPLKIDDDPLVDPDWRLANHMLKSAGFTLPWIELLKEIDAEIEAARANLRRSWEWCRSRRQPGGSRRQPGGSQAESGVAPVHADSMKLSPAEIEAEWSRAVKAFRDQVQVINKRIFDYNLQAPSERFQRFKLNPEKEIEKIKSGL